MGRIFAFQSLDPGVNLTSVDFSEESLLDDISLGRQNQHSHLLESTRKSYPQLEPSLVTCKRHLVVLAQSEVNMTKGFNILVLC